MFFIVSKTLSFLLKPLGISMGLMLLGILYKNRTKQKKLILIAVIFLYLCSCPLVVNSLFRIYEPELIKINDLEKTYEVGIVLTGGITNNNNAEEVSLGSQSDRIWKALELYRTQKIKKILISGGEWRSEYKSEKIIENDKSRFFLIKNYVKPEDIIQERTSRNTHENAVYSKKTLNDLNIKGEALVITTAFHCKRTILCFNNAGIKHRIFPVGFLNNPRKTVSVTNLVPDAQAFREMDMLFSECIGIIAYKFAGYI